MVIGQLGGNLLGGVMSHWVGLENVFFVSASSIFVGMILILFTKDQNYNRRCGVDRDDSDIMDFNYYSLCVSIYWFN